MANSEFFDLARAEMLFRNPNIRPEVIDSPGSGLNTECRIIAVAAEELEARSIIRHTSRFLDTARGQDLSAWGMDRYRIPFQEDSKAIVPLSIARTDTTTSVTLPAGSVVVADNGARFRTLTKVTLPIGDNGPRLTNGLSVITGSSQNVGVGEVTTFETTPPDPSMTVTNQEFAAGGNDREPEWAYRERLRAAYKASSGATPSALELVALSVPSVASATAFVPTQANGNTYGVVQLAVSDQDGRANSAVSEQVTAALRDTTAAGTIVEIIETTPQIETIVYVVSWLPGFATLENLALTKRVVAFRVNQLAANAGVASADAPEDSKLTPQMVWAAVAAIQGVASVTVSHPAGVVVPPAGTIIKTTVEDITAT